MSNFEKIRAAFSVPHESWDANTRRYIEALEADTERLQRRLTHERERADAADAHRTEIIRDMAAHAAKADERALRAERGE